MPSRRQWLKDASDLVNQVDHVRLKGIAAYEDAKLWKFIPLLMQMVQPDGVPLRSSQAPDALRKLFSAAISRIDSTALRGAAMALFGVRHGAPDTLEQRLKDAFKAHSGRSPEYRTILDKPDFERGIIKEVAAQIEALIAERELATRAGPVDEDFYVQRPELQARCKALIRDGARIVVLAGEAGVGKSALARRVAYEIRGKATEVAEIDAQPDRIFDTLVKVLVRYLEAGVANRVEAALRFARILGNRQGGPRVLIVDNVDDELTIADLVPADAPVTVIVTTNRTSLGEGQWPVVTVDGLTAPQAMEMIQGLLPAVDAEAADRLARALGGNPLAIEQVCGYLSQPRSMSLDDFLTALAQNAAMTLKLPRQARPLTVMYDRALSQMDEDVLRALDIVLSAGSTGVPVNYVADLWANLDDASADVAASPQLATITLNQALAELEDRSIIRLHRLRRDPAPQQPAPGTTETVQPPIHEMIGIHSLTRRILRSLRSTHVAATARRVLARLDAAPVLTEWGTGRTLPLAALLQRKASVHLVMTAPDDLVAAHPGACALALRCAYQLGQMPTDLADRAALAWNRQATARSADGLNPAATPLSVELVHYVACNPHRSYASATQDALAAIRHHNSGLWHAMGLLPGTEWLPAPALGTPVQPMLALTDSVISGCWTAMQQTEADERRYNQAMLARWFAIRGKLNFDLGRFEAAEQCWVTALHNYRILGAAEYHTDILECLRQLAETALKAGRYDDANQRLQEAHAIVSQHDAPEGSDYVAVLRHQQTIARLSLSRRLRSAQPGALPELGDWSTAVYEHILNLVRTGPFSVLYPSAQHDVLCRQALTDPLAAHDGLITLAHWANQHRWHFAHLRCRLTALKLRAHLATERNGPHIRRRDVTYAHEVARIFRRHYGAGYWSADTLALEVTLGRLAGQPEPAMSQARARAKQALDSIGRLDKLTIAEDVGEGRLSAIALLAE